MIDGALHTLDQLGLHDVKARVEDAMKNGTLEELAESRSLPRGPINTWAFLRQNGARSGWLRELANIVQPGGFSRDAIGDDDQSILITANGPVGSDNLGHRMLEAREELLRRAEP